MINNAFIYADDLFSKFELEGVVCYPSADKHCCLSCTTNDGLVFLYNKDKQDNYTLKEFGLRKWSPIHAILDMRDYEDNDSISITPEEDEFGFPKILYFQVGKVRMTHYLQNYTFISNQTDLLNLYKQKKFELIKAKDSIKQSLSKEVVKTAGRMATMLNEKFFRIGGASGSNYLYFGDENQSIDFAKLDLGNIGGISTWKNDTYFSYDYFSQLYRAMGSDNVRINVTPTQIIMMADDEKSLKIGILRGKVM